MARVPTPLKRWLLPAWNFGHHVARAVALRADAILHGRVERCAACGRLTPLLVEPRAIPPRLIELWGLSPRQSAALVRKETSLCVHCQAKLRGRRLAQTILNLLPVAPPAGSLTDWARRPETHALRIAELNRIDGVHQALVSHPNFAASDYHEGARPGEIVNGVRHEDLTQLTYPDASFDLVLTSETLEHVPDLPRALTEIRRILAPGGHHVFTIPARPDLPHSFLRMDLRPDGTILDLAPRLCHPGGDWGYPVFTEFGADAPALIAAHGFEVQVRFGPLSDDDLAQVYIATRID